LQTPKGGHFTEFDLIKLVSIYAGLQEKTSSVLREQICFSCGESKPQDLSALLMAIGGNEVPPDSKIMGGTVQVITKDDRHSSIDWQELNVQMNELHNGDNKITAYENLRSQYEKKEEYKLILNTLAGIILGIFHFDRYFFTELADTFTPLVEMRDEFIRLINKTLTILVPKEIPDELFFRIGITPYMLIPHAVMIHNTMQINHVLQHLCQLLNAEKYNIRELEKAREDAERRLNRDFVPSVFRYRTEKDILANAFRETGAAEKFTLAQNMLTETIERIYAVKRRHERRFMLGIGLASTFFAGFGFHPVVDQFFPEVLGAKNGTWEWVALALFLGLSLVALFVLLLTGTKAERRQGET
jgi:hypothetical protein